MRRAAAVGLALVAGACAPAIGTDPVPGAMQFDPTASPPRVPSPTGLIVNPDTGRIDFSLAGLTVSTDCAGQQTMPEAACEFDRYLETLDGFPSVTPAQAPASVALEPDTLTLGDNVVVLAGDGTPLTDVDVAFDGPSDTLTVTPRASWALGASVWVGVRGYDNGVRALDGSEVVGSPTQFLLKQDAALTCGISDPSLFDRTCPAFDLLLSQGLDHDAAGKALLELEQARLGYLAAGAWGLLDAAGLPKAEVAALWGFPIQTASVAELSPAIVPVVAAPNEIHVAVHGPVDATTVAPFVLKQQSGSVVVMDLDVVATDLPNGLPQVDAKLVGGDIVITGAAPFAAGHHIGLFLTNGIQDGVGNALVASPLSVLLTLQGSLVAADGHSAVPGLFDADALALEPGRRLLAPLFDNAALTGLTGISRQNLVYCFAFTFPVTP